MIRILFGALMALSYSSLMAQTAWQAPVAIATSGRAARVTTTPNDTVAAAWIGTNKVTSGTQTINKTSNVYTAFSYDRGLTWSTPKMISDPAVSNIDVSIDAADEGTIRYTWTSGDALSGYRLHLASTSDDGNSFTSSTVLQTVEDPNQGILYPEILSLTSQSLVASTFITTDYTSGTGGFISVQSEPTGELQLVDKPEGPETSGSLISTNMKSLAVGNGVVIAAGTKQYTATPNPIGAVFIVRSIDYGQTWEDSKPITTNTLNAINPVIKYDGNGTWQAVWLLITSVQYGRGRIMSSTSTDDGLTWATPVTVRSLYGGQRNSIDLCSDGSGNWLIADNRGSPFGYMWSNDNGSTWNEGPDLNGSLTFPDTNACDYLGDGKWGVIWSSWKGVYISLLDWGTSAVGGWELY